MQVYETFVVDIYDSLRLPSLGLGCRPLWFRWRFLGFAVDSEFTYVIYER